MYREKIDQYFAMHREEMITDICTLIKKDSVKSEPLEGMPFGRKNAEVLKIAEKIITENGFKVNNYENYVITTSMGSENSGLDILAHLDVVPADEKDWTLTKPFEPLIKDGRIYGRGSSDDKGPAMAAFYAMKAVKDLCIPLKKGVRLILGADEESGSSDIHYFYSVEKPAEMTFSPDSDFPVINCEKGGYWSAFSGSFQAENENTARKVLFFHGGTAGNAIPGEACAELTGINTDELEKECRKAEKELDIQYEIRENTDRIYVKVKGKGAHASTPENGNNAITALLHIISACYSEGEEATDVLRKMALLFPHNDYYGMAAGVNMEDQESGKLTLNLTILDYDGEKISGRIDCRTPVCATEEKLIPVLKKEFRECGLELEEDSMCPAHLVPESSEFIQKLLKCYEKYTGQKGYCITTGGMTYTHHIENGVAFGCVFPGQDTHMHGADEFVDIEELILSAKMFTQAIIDLCC